MAHSPTCRPKLSNRDGSQAQTLHILRSLRHGHIQRHILQLQARQPPPVVVYFSLELSLECCQRKCKPMQVFGIFRRSIAVAIFGFGGPAASSGSSITHIMEMSSCCCSSSGSGSGVARFHKRVDLQPFNTSDDPEQQRDNEHERQPKTFRSVICNRPWRRHRDGAGAGAPQRSFPNPIQSAKPSPNPRASWKCSNVLVCQLIIAASEWKLPLEAAKA